MSKIAVRGYTQKIKESSGNPFYIPKDVPLRHDRVLVFDTETTIDQYQNFKIGYFKIYQDVYIQHEGMFHDTSMLTDNENKVCVVYTSKYDIPLYTLNEFIDEVFYPEVFGLKTLCVGFNLPFDISRISKRVGDSRGRNKGGFTFTLSDNRFNPPIIVKKLGDAHTFKLTSTKINKGKDHFSGYFLDAQKLAEVLLQSKRISLDKAGQKLDTNVKKMKGIEHGKVTERYIDYLIDDVETTYQVYEKLIDELELYQISIPPTKIFSSASIGKYALGQLGIQSFLDLNPEFSSETIGTNMTSYYGGRCECKIGKEPTNVTVLDFTSMYPTITMEMDLWKYMIAESLEMNVVTDEIKGMLNTLTLNYLQDKDNWKEFVVMVKLQLDNDILPVRMDYKGNNTGYNVGVNYLTSDNELWYALPDVIASVLLTGKVPEIIEAIRYVPKGVQKGLNQSQILGIDVDPTKDNLVQVLVEERQNLKIQMKSIDKDKSEYQQLESRAQAIKILVNAMSYGIFIELNPEDNKTDIQVYGLDDFNTSENRFEKAGNYFHPLLAVMITAGSKLFLAMAEAKVKELGSVHAYMDTDSIFVPPEHAQEIIDYFQPLNPYILDIDLLKAEKEDVWFYGISSKRYALYTYENGNIKFMEGERSFKLHGLGHLTNPFPKAVEDWQAEIWEDILKLHYGIISELDIEKKYSNMYAISRLTVSTANVLHRFDVINKGKEWIYQIKPFNFYHVGFQVAEEDGKAVKPLSPFSNDPQNIVYDPFIDYATGEIKEGSHYFKPLSRTIIQYVDHLEHKFDGKIGVLERKHVHADSVIYIGKEANNIDEQELDVKKAQEFIDEKLVYDLILKLTPEKARDIGIKHRSALAYLKKKAKEGKLNFKSKNVKRIAAASN
ncbi:DNA polymerase [Methanococcoides burtonii]|uniref:DNA polymerase n=1 Tax=Methanococcoides burtonii (strain DSM 6242 / NBRC 107633 / OCM 468 / ACE-M) TaxID=259564 RepID=Q12YD7_METBU|nr:DNA polymerase [Methanococcoides burtonii]ABE51539.1 protein with DNA-directed DNA polymerase B domain [Methanococcoides burtonii DSM 6242]